MLLEVFKSHLIFLSDLLDRLLHLLLRCHIVTGRKNSHLLWIAHNLARQWVDLQDTFHFIAKELYPISRLSPRGIDVDRITPHSEVTPSEIQVVAVILDIAQMTQELVVLVALT